MNRMDKWPSPAHMPVLGDGEVQVWRIHLNADTASAEAMILNDEEHSRCDRMLELPRIRFTCARAAMRKILSAYLCRDPRSLSFVAGPHGKLHLQDHPVHFNLSHAGDLALLAATRAGDIGVDIEKVDHARALKDIAARFFSTAEQAALARMDGQDFVRGFFRCWSRKEAVIKALGEGLACPLGLFDVSLDAASASLRAFRRADVDVARWFMSHLDVHENYEAAVAVIGAVEKVAGFAYRGDAGIFPGQS